MGDLEGFQGQGPEVFIPLEKNTQAKNVVGAPITAAESTEEDVANSIAQIRGTHQTQQRDGTMDEEEFRGAGPEDIIYSLPIQGGEDKGFTGILEPIGSIEPRFEVSIRCHCRWYKICCSP
jgi:hypothetical protein